MMKYIAVIALIALGCGGVKTNPTPATATKKPAMHIPGTAFVYTGKSIVVTKSDGTFYTLNGNDTLTVSTQEGKQGYPFATTNENGLVYWVCNTKCEYMQIENKILDLCAPIN
jgi:hypothetical protein